MQPVAPVRSLPPHLVRLARTELDSIVSSELLAFLVVSMQHGSGSDPQVHIDIVPKTPSPKGPWSGGMWSLNDVVAVL